MKQKQHAATLLLTLLVATGAQLHIVYAQETNPQAQIDEIFIAWDSPDSPGCAVSVMQDGAIVYKRGYGMANLEYGVPITPSSIFHVASVSKQFTAFAVLLLGEEGKLSLDDDVRKYVEEVRIPGHVGRLFRLKPATCSDRCRPAIPGQGRPLFGFLSESVAGLPESVAGMPGMGGRLAPESLVG